MSGRLRDADSKCPLKVQSQRRIVNGQMKKAQDVAEGKMEKHVEEYIQKNGEHVVREMKGNRVCGLSLVIV